MIACDLCNKSFKYPCHLKRHLKGKRQCTENNTHLTENNTHLTENNTHLTEKECKYCNRNFTRSWSLKKHLKSCYMRHDHIVIYELELGIKQPPQTESNSCIYCNIKFMSKQSYQRHMRSSCKAKDKYEKELETRVLKARSDYGNAKVINNNTTNNNNCTNIENQNIIHINLPPLRAFGDENLDYITMKELVKELKKIKDVGDLAPLISNFTKLIHANPAHPENHNVQIMSLNGSHGKVFNGQSFENEAVSTIQDRILNQIGNTVIEKVDENADKVDEEVGGLYKREQIMDTLDDEVKGEIGRSNDSVSRKYRNKVKHVLYNNREAISSTEKIMK